MTWDGTGEDTTTLFSRGDDTNIKVLKRIKLPHSLGQFYSAVTNFIGFDMFGGDEWKVMGLAAYGRPEFYDFFARRILTVNGNQDFHLNIRVLDHHLAKHYQFSKEIIKELGPPRRPDEELTQRHWNIAASAQKILEDTALYLLRGLYERTGEENLCMAGGVAFNSVMNGRIFHETPFRNFYVQPAAGADHACHLYVVRVPDRDAVRRRLEQRSVATGVHYPTPIHLMRGYAFLGGRAGQAPVAERLAQEVLSLPLYPELQDADVERVAAAVQASI